ncbi:protein crumbs homolog 1-like [Syngnathus typhle]|uniref:protein crumbs homolog 1-like n=1 Tax=Syngnathus typhle TaxID=161592 RepID=UPI002A6B1EC4|nr:protein crumbs homolog 1-like [Syngnathus typhle]
MELGKVWSRHQRTLLITMMMFKLGLLCTAAADKCLSSPCNNGATCFEHLGDYVCLCPKEPVWYMGKNCDELYDACILAPCTNCTSSPGTGNFTCHCPDGFTGVNCTEDVDECESNPCKGVRSHCVNRIDAYSCHCPHGFGGKYCEFNVTTCSEETCHNSGTCIDIPDIGHHCQCDAGYQGDNCEENINECESAPCQNGAICKDGVNAYQCFCVPGFQGFHCDLDINECASQPCQNNGTCSDEVDNYSCDCTEGFKGNNCEVDIDDCEEQPCQNGATCHDYIAMYTCECMDGFQGQDCEVNIDECVSMPCLNDGRCIDGVNSYICDCEGTGFEGHNCEEDVPECASDPCQHGGTCMEGTNQYKCLCWPGYEGENCQVDEDECEQYPCENDGECFQRSEIENYGVLPELSAANFSFEEAAGFICHCQSGFTGENCSLNVDECVSAPCQHGGSCQDLVNSYQCLCSDGFTGVHCDVDIDECDSNPCQNGATCEDAANSYICHCPEPETGREPLGGRNCDVVLVGCQQHNCQHDGICMPLLTAYGDHSYTCLCGPGWTGELCNTSTTFSFNSEGYVHMQLPVSKNRGRQGTDDYNYGLSVQLRFRSTLPDMLLYHRGTLEHFISLELVQGSLQARLKFGRLLQVIYPGPVNDGEWYRVTVTMDERLIMLVEGPGCEEGCQVKNLVYNHLIFFQSNSFQQLFVGGAPKEYLTLTLSGRNFIGCMEDLQVDYKLLMPQDLMREDNMGLELGCVKEDVCHDDPCKQFGFCVDMWVVAKCQCRRPYFGERCEREYPSWTFGHENTTSYAAFNIKETHGENVTISFIMRSLKKNGLLLQFRRGERSYLTLYLKEATVAIYSAYTTLLSEAKFVTDGKDNLVTIKVNYGHVFFPIAGNHRAIGNVSIEAGDVVYVGGLPVGENVNSWGGKFKGCLQDIRLDNKHLSFVDYKEEVESYQATAEKNVLTGCQSDNSCKNEPCLNDGKCQIIWNDFKCDCSINFSGRLCERRLWCVENPCFEGGQCVDLWDGYECLTQAIFQDNALEYFANSSLLSPVTNIMMEFRTRDDNGILLRAEDGDEVFCLGLLNSTLLVKMDTGTSGDLLAFTSDRTIADGAWHRIRLTMIDPAQSVSRWCLTVDGQTAGCSLGVGGFLNFLNDTQIWLAEKYSGCLGEVRVGGVYLPIFSVPDAPQTSHFSRLSGREPNLGCQGAPVCDSQPCFNEGVCQDHFNEFNCSCNPGWSGELCEAEINECSSGPCFYGTCKDLLADYQCDCEPGYIGRNCQEEVDNCLEFICLNEGTCVETTVTHTCVCPPEYLGKRCQWRFPPAACDAKTECLNGGVCIGGDTGGNCTCKPGYTGARCETEIDECTSSPCLNGATCLDRLNHFQCVCVPGYSGTLCESNKKAQLERIPWLVVTIPITTLCVLVAIVVIFFLIMTARKKRQSEGTYSPSSQEVAGARLEMGSVLKVPPEERLI